MKTYIVLLRGINVGGKNKIPMADLKSCLIEHNFESVQTYIQSGNVILRSNLPADEIRKTIELVLPASFALDSKLIKVHILDIGQLHEIVQQKPDGFGEQPEIYHSDVIFLMNISMDAALSAFKPRPGVDTIWPGNGVVYSQRLSQLRTKSRLNKIMESPLYQSMTIRNWNTTTKLFELAAMINEHG